MHPCDIIWAIWPTYFSPQRTDSKTEAQESVKTTSVVRIGHCRILERHNGLHYGLNLIQPLIFDSKGLSIDFVICLRNNTFF